MNVEHSPGAGASGIWVTNHGGRQIDGGPAAFDSLQEVAEAVDKRVPIVFLTLVFVVVSMFLKRWLLEQI